jgi:hypothetical protein
MTNNKKRPGQLDQGRHQSRRELGAVRSGARRLYAFRAIYAQIDDMIDKMGRDESVFVVGT